jgi:hypothetical protein
MDIDQEESIMKPRPSSSIKRSWIFLSIGLVTLLILGLLIQEFMAAQAKIAIRPTPPIDPDLLSLQKELQRSNIDNEYRHKLETNVAILIYNATRQAEGMARLPAYQPIRSLAVTEVEIPDSRRLTGIIDYPSVPLPSAEFLDENGWCEKINDGYVIVLAGAYGNDPQQGELIVIAEHPLRFKFVNSPNKAGALKIVDFKGFQLVVQAKNSNTLLYFDVPGYRFISSLGEVVPTVTPFTGVTPALVITATPIPAYP